MNRKGEAGSHILSFGFLFMIILVALGIAGGTAIFFGGDYDARSIDADILNYRIKGCINEGKINFDSKSLLEEFYKNCRLNKKVIEERNFAFKVCLDSSDCINENNPIIVFGSNFNACSFTGVKDNSAFAKCSLSAFSSNGKTISVITTSNQLNRKRLVAQ